MGYINVHNGGSPANIFSVLGLSDQKPKPESSTSGTKAYKKPSFLDDEYDHLA